MQYYQKCGKCNKPMPDSITVADGKLWIYCEWCGEKNEFAPRPKERRAVD